MLKKKKRERKGSQRKGGNLMNLYPRKVTDREMINSLSQTVSACWTPSKLGDIITLLCNVISIPRAKVGRSRGAKDHRRLGSKSSHPRLWHWHWRETPPPSLHSLKKKKKSVVDYGWCSSHKREGHTTSYRKSGWYWWRERGAAPVSGLQSRCSSQKTKSKQMTCG